MDLGKSVEDQFSKKHPCLPVNTRIGIVGGGPSGLSAAYALTRLGYRNVTVLEKYHTVGGMCESVEIEGKVYDLGGQVLAANSAPVIFHLAKEAKSELEEMDSHKLALLDPSTGKYQDIKVVDDYMSVISLTLEIQDKAKDSGRIGVHAVSNFASELTPTFLEKRGFKSVPKSVAYGYTASGYGFPQDMPYAYIHEFTRTSMAGKIRRFRGGYMSFWEKLSKCLSIQVRCNTDVLAVRRSSAVVSVDIKNLCEENEVMEFDKVIISGAFPVRHGKTYRSSSMDSTDCETRVMDMDDLEKELFSKVQTIDYYTTVLKIRGLEHLPIGFYYFSEYMEDPATIGHPVAMQKFFADTDIFLFWSYGNSLDIIGPTVTELAIKTVVNMGGAIEKVVLQRRFKYFPHVSSKDMKDGFYEKVESNLQGLKNTYYIGGLVAFELTERNASYAIALVCKHFANSNSEPIYPYVKSLFPLQSDNNCRGSKDLGELPDLEFPDLSTLDGYLKHWGTHKVTLSKTLYTWINEEGEAVNQRTYAELHANASCIAHKLLTNRKPIIKQGDRVLLVFVPGLDFVDAFFGCLRAKVLPVPVLPPDPLQRGGQALLKIENISKTCSAVAILSSIGYHTAVRAGSVKDLMSLTGKKGKNSASWPNLPWLHTDSWIKNSKNLSFGGVDEFSEPSRLDDLCFLQFTSGSTGDAKGVMITHGGLIHNVKLMRRRYRSTSRTVLVSWLPQYHDMGLIGGLFTSLVSGGSAILFSPLTFIRKPLLWLEIMSKNKATHSAGPNFAFELVVRRLEKEKSLDYDLSSMVFLMVAAEPVRQITLKRFVEFTRGFGLSQEVMAPGYGLAENCVFVSCAFGEGKPIVVDWQGRVCCGYVGLDDADVDVRIVDPETGKEIEEIGKEGEIWISSPSSGIGYWGKEELSKKTFRNELLNYPGSKYMRTGDLGRIIDGKLFITGRIKDLIIVAGRNIYSADVEKTVESTSEVLRPGCCAVVGVPEDILSAKGISFSDSSDQVGLVVIAEVKDGKPVAKDVTEQIKTRVAEEHGVTVADVKLIRPRTISKTTSGKIKRFECLKQFVDGNLNVVPEPIISKRTLIRSFTTGTCKEGKTPRPQLEKSPLSRQEKRDAKEIEEFLVGLVSEQTGILISNISITESLVSYGIDSIGVVRAAQKLSDFVGVSVGPVDIFTATCIRDLAKFSENLIMKAQPQETTNLSDSLETQIEYSSELVTEVSKACQMSICLFQVLALIYASAMLIFPAYLSIFVFMKLISMSPTWIDGFSGFEYIFPLALAPVAWIACIISTCACIAFFGNSFLQPNYLLNPEIPMWSTNFVKWWALYKAQSISSRVLAVHLRGTVFLNAWFEMLGSKIGSSVLLDTVDITDASLISIGDGVVIAEGTLIQSHEIKNGVLRFAPVRIGRNSTVGPYAVIQKGSVIGEEVEVAALQKCEGGKPILGSTKKTNIQKGGIAVQNTYHKTKKEAIFHFFGIYMIGFFGSFVAAIVYFFYIWLSQNPASLQQFSFFCISGAFHWMPFTFVAYITIFAYIPSNPAYFSLSIAVAYLFHGLLFGFVTCTLTRFFVNKQEEKQSHLKAWLRHRFIAACHFRFSKLLSGTEVFCTYLRLLGAKIGEHCSIRAINAISFPERIKIGYGVHLGDFSRIVAGFYSSNGFISGKIEIQDNSVIGSQSLLLPNSTIQKDVILGALSVAPMHSVLQRGGIYIGSETPVMIKNTRHALDDRIEEMDMKYKKIVGNLAANLAVTTLKVKSRYFHRIGVGGKGQLRIYENIKGLPDHKIFRCGKSYPIVIRHSNSLSADDDARLDARGAAIRILSDEAGDSPPLLDLTLKTGKAFYARTIVDFATWLVCGLAAREEHVKRVPHVRDAVWTSLCRADSYAELHYYSNICRLFRFADGQEMYVKFKLRPNDKKISEDNGKVEPIGILPPETGAISRDENDTRPLLFLAEEFQNRVNSPSGVCYVLQLQVRPVPDNEAVRDIVLDCTKPWDETEFPYIDVGEVVINESLSRKESETLEFNPYLKCHEVDVIPASSCSQSASIDHGRSLIYEICQHLRNRDPLPEPWRIFLEQSDTKVDLSGCPMAATMENEGSEKVTLMRNWYQNSWAIFVQPLLQIVLPYFLMGLVIYTPLHIAISLKESKKISLYWLLPLFWVSSGILATLACIVAKWILVGKRKEGDSLHIWSRAIFMDTIWQAFRTLVCDYFMDMTSGSFLFVLWMKLMGSGIELGRGTYVDSTGALLNPEMVEIEGGGCIGRDALLFGHMYEGDGGKVKYGKIRVGQAGFVGSRAVVMPGVRVESGGSLGALSLAMKEEIIKFRN